MEYIREGLIYLYEYWNEAAKYTAEAVPISTEIFSFLTRLNKLIEPYSSDGISGSSEESVDGIEKFFADLGKRITSWWY